jgi:hypothetical protein
MIRALLLAWLLVTSQELALAETGRPLYSGNEPLEYCRDADNHTNMIHCLGYIIGVADQLTVQQESATRSSWHHG